MIVIDIHNRAKGNPLASPRYYAKIGGNIKMADGKKMKAVRLRYRNSLPQSFASDNLRDVQDWAGAVSDWFYDAYLGKPVVRYNGFRNDWYKGECISRYETTRGEDRKYLVGLCTIRNGKPFYCGPYLRRNLQSRIRDLRKVGDKNIFAVRFKVSP